MQNTNDFTMDVQVLINIEATSYGAVFSIRQVAETAEEVNVLLNQRVDSFREQLKSLGIQRNEVIVDLISQVPIYGQETMKKIFSKSLQEVPLGFELQKTILVRYDEYDLLNDIVYIASKNEIYDLIKVDYFAANPHLYFDTMRHAANVYLNAIYDQYKANGFELDSFNKMMMENTGTIYPISRYRKYQSVSRLSYDKLLKKAGDGVTMTSAVASPVLYYDPLPFTDFDLVINTEINRPCIQYTLNLKAHYIRKQPAPVRVEKTVERQYFMLTPEGEIKYVPLK